ncbi:hypothetical protein NDU88_004552 [Pleurodeles waltl]|uniref:Uncharacterized protein n=1 Tax=Pleurodeles waltl TaxID=8319 RepID=A0AAV7VJ49_PLEWA|nr:hypothetical protein NDU88_004552 [Pleurodeles waltl]
MIKSHLICWQVKLIDELLQYAKYCSDEIELKQKKLKEKAMVMQIKAAQTGAQGNFIQQMPQQHGNVMFQPQMRVKELHPDLQGTVRENGWNLTGKEVVLIKGVEPIMVTLKSNAVFPKLPQNNMAQDVLMKVSQIITDFVKQGVLKEMLSSPCNSPIMGLKKPCGKV